MAQAKKKTNTTRRVTAKTRTTAVKRTTKTAAAATKRKRTTAAKAAKPARKKTAATGGNNKPRTAAKTATRTRRAAASTKTARKSTAGRKSTAAHKPAAVPKTTTTRKTTAARKSKLSPFKKKDLNRFKALLLEEHARLKEELEEIEARAARAIEIEAAGELSDYDDHPADVASETFEREKDLAMADSTASLLVKVNNAIAKVEKRTYGICDICGGPIKVARLRAIPFATLCVNCQERMEIR